MSQTVSSYLSTEDYAYVASDMHVISMAFDGF